MILEETRSLVAAGCTYIQFNAPEILQLASEGPLAEHWEHQGLPARHAAAEGIDVLRGIAANLPDDVTCGLHLCGDYQVAAGHIFPRITGFDRLLLDYGSPAPEAFEPLAAMPGDITVVLGLVSAMFPRARDTQALTACVTAAARYTGLDRLAISLRCGFAHEASGLRMSRTQQQARLRLAADAARLSSAGVALIWCPP